MLRPAELVRALLGAQEILRREVPTGYSIPLLCREVVELLGCDRSAVLLLLDDHYQWMYNWGTPPAIFEALSRWRVARSELIPQKMEHGEAPLIMNDVLDDDALGEVARIAEINGLVLVPLSADDGTPLGIMTAEYSEKVGSFSEFEALVLLGAAGLVQTAIRDERSRTEQQRLAAVATAAQESERRRLALELHDYALQDAYAVCLRLEILERKVANGDLAAEFDEAIVASRIAAKRLRMLTNDMHPDTNPSGVFEDVLRNQLIRYGDDDQCRFSFQDVTTSQPGPGALLAFGRITDQAMHNIRAHADATEVAVSLHTVGAGTQLAICDNGRGFDTHHVVPGHLGLISMREHAQNAGGSLNLMSGDSGTTVEAWLPHAVVDPLGSMVQ